MALSDPSGVAVAVTPSDSVNFTRGVCRGLYVGVSGDVVGIVDGVAVTFASMAAGMVHPIMFTRINSTSTTATGLVALY